MRISNGRRGQALAELAFVLPVMLLLLLGALDLGRLFYAQITIENAAKEGALVASRGGSYVSGGICSSTNTVMCAVLNEAKGGFVEVDSARVAQAPSVVKACPVTAAIGTTVSVTVQAPFQLITPFIGDVIGQQNLTVSAAANAECAVLPSTALSPVPTPTPVACPVASFTATPSANKTFPHRMDFAGSIAPSTSGWTWTWSFGQTGKTVNNHDFSASGPIGVTLTVTKGTCSVTSTQTVNVP
ncbi:MAG: TadE/TadG family type IV pilus assembly protein [Chloroflexota bacterium]